MCCSLVAIKIFIRFSHRTKQANQVCVPLCCSFSFLHKDELWNVLQYGVQSTDAVCSTLQCAANIWSARVHDSGWVLLLFLPVWLLLFSLSPALLVGFVLKPVQCYESSLYSTCEQALTDEQRLWTGRQSKRLDCLLIKPADCSYFAHFCSASSKQCTENRLSVGPNTVKFSLGGTP